MAENSQGTINQPIDLSSPRSEQYLQLEGRDNHESDHEEETGHSRDEKRNESGLPSTPNTSPPGELLHDIELAQILANMNYFIQLESLFNFNLG